MLSAKHRVLASSLYYELICVLFPGTAPGTLAIAHISGSTYCIGIVAEPRRSPEMGIRICYQILSTDINRIIRNVILTDTITFVHSWYNSMVSVTAKSYIAFSLSCRRHARHD